VTPNDAALVIFARSPVPGRVKTRLLPVFTPEEACEIHRALLGDVVERSIRSVGATASITLAWSEPPPAGSFGIDLPDTIAVEAQAQGDLGERMAFAVQSKMRAGFRRVVILGTDAPTLPGDHLAAAFAALREVEVVLGPAGDGGYYLVGLSKLRIEIFRDIRWGSPEVLAATHKRLRKLGVPYRDLGMWHDVDTPEDAARLWKEILRMKERRAPEIPARTWAILSRLAPGRLPG